MLDGESTPKRKYDTSNRMTCVMETVSNLRALMAAYTAARPYCMIVIFSVQNMT